MLGTIDTGDFTASAIKKLLMFQVNVTFTFCGIVAYGICISATRSEPVALVFVVGLTINSGGWINGLIYYAQEYHGFGSAKNAKIASSKGSGRDASNFLSKNPSKRTLSHLASDSRISKAYASADAIAPTNN
ncbi:hypothetical protein BC830DRAFT_488796 [Chytriomyces sp. MP71]|nr:hypothetical protein BC830DRAFT_488796 [Chytriomyces sp. MP71]